VDASRTRLKQDYGVKADDGVARRVPLISQWRCL